jgi:hypothetical protein
MHNRVYKGSISFAESVKLSRKQMRIKESVAVFEKNTFISHALPPNTIPNGDAIQGQSLLFCEGSGFIVLGTNSDNY